MQSRTDAEKVANPPKVPNAPTWGIQEIADIFDITPRAIRFYEDKGLISPSRQSGARVFDTVDYGRLERILRGKRLGFTLDDIKTVLDVTDGKITDPEDLMERRDNFQRVISSLKRRRNDIEKLAHEMGELCALIDTHLETAGSQANGLHMATAYEEAFRKHLADDFGGHTI